MIVNKLLSIKKDNNIVLYSVSFDSEKLYNFLDHLDQSYSRIENDVVETAFAGLIPLNYGKYDTMQDICIVREQGLYQTRKERESKEYFKSLGGTVEEWDFLSEDEKRIFMPIDGLRKGKLKLEVEYPSVLVKIIKDTFLNSDVNKCIIDGTNLTKLSNGVLGINNKFVFDKTIDLNDNKKNWNDPGKAFFSNEDYNAYLNSCARNINKNNLKITTKESKHIYDDLGYIVYNLQNLLQCEQVGMFPMDISLSEEFEILKRFGIRNESFEWLDRKLESAEINFDGGAIVNGMKDNICYTYDLDGSKTEKRILSKIDKKADYIQKLLGIKSIVEDEESPINLSENINHLTKKIKAA